VFSVDYFGASALPSTTWTGIIGLKLEALEEAGEGGTGIVLLLFNSLHLLLTCPPQLCIYPQFLNST